MQLVEGVLAGNRLALSRLMTQVENDTPEGRTALDSLFPFAGKAHLVGITGSPGAGKSSLVNQLARMYRQSTPDHPQRRVGIVAVDPTSPFTGGAILGDRVRMRDLAGDPGVFIRSMASRGALGGLAQKTAAIVQLLDAAGYDVIIIETVGAGQSEVNIARLAHTTLVVEAPGMGDEIQAIKAGILEIADILVVNKADHVGVENTTRALKAMINLAHPTRIVKGKHSFLQQELDPADRGPAVDGWIPPVHRTVATTNEGVEGLFQSMLRHETYLRSTDEWKLREQKRLKNDLDNLIQSALFENWRSSTPDEFYESVLNRLEERKLSPYEALSELLKAVP